MVDLNKTKIETQFKKMSDFPVAFQGSSCLLVVEYKTGVTATIIAAYLPYYMEDMVVLQPKKGYDWFSSTSNYSKLVKESPSFKKILAWAFLPNPTKEALEDL